MFARNPTLIPQKAWGNSSETHTAITMCYEKMFERNEIGAEERFERGSSAIPIQHTFRSPVFISSLLSQTLMSVWTPLQASSPY